MTKTTQILPEDWKIKKIEDFAKIQTGKKDTQNKKSDGKYPFFVRSQTIEQIDSYSFDGEAILTAGDGVGVGKVFHYIVGKFDYHQRVYKISHFNGVNGRYFYEYFQTYFMKEVSKYNAKASVDSVRLDMIAKMEIPFPPLSEQQKIADILSTWDEAIQTTQNLIKKLEIRKNGLMQSLMSGKTRLNGFSEKWTRGKIEDVTTNFSRRNKKIVDAPVYSVTNSNGFVLQSEHFSRGIAGDDLSNYKIIKKNEFAYNPARINVGSIAFFEDEIGVISSLYVCFSTNEKMIDYYLQELLKLDYTKHQIENLGEGGVRVYLWYDLFSKIKITIPPIEEQKAIIQILKTADAELNETKAYLETLKQQKKGLMQQLLTGKIRVKTIIDI